MHCPSCGRDTPDSYDHCRHCGAELRPSLLSRIAHALHLPGQAHEVPPREPVPVDEEPEGIEMPAFQEPPAGPIGARPGARKPLFAQAPSPLEPQTMEQVPEVLGAIEAEPLTQLPASEMPSKHSSMDAMDAEVTAAINTLVENVELVMGRHADPAPQAEGVPHLQVSLPSTPKPPAPGGAHFADRPITEGDLE